MFMFSITLYVRGFLFFLSVCMMESFMPKGLRKGAWTEEEDNLLRKCVLKFGEGRWHQVPLRAGLNRCRKSCRLRWLNYLKPNIKRGDFKDDEVDLILKLHRLLGNRWSLIAGRLPGRTANDIKNYWNTHLNKNKQRPQQQKRTRKTLVGVSSIDSNNVVKPGVFKPRPRTFSKTTPWVWKNKDMNIENNVDIQYQYTTSTCSDIQNQTSSMELMMNHELDEWWESLLFDKELEQVMNDHVHNHNWWESLLFNKEDCDAAGKKD